MTPSATSYAPALDVLRGAAVMMVVLHHALVPGFGGGGLAGVTLFFVLSAFLITTRLLDGRPIGLLRFYEVRVRRIYPALVALVVALAAYGLLERRLEDYLGRGARALSGLLNWLTDPSESLLQLGHLWTISVELQFYAVWGLVVLVVARRRAVWVAAFATVVLVASLAIRVLLFDRLGWQRIYLGTDSRADAFALGALASVAVGTIAGRRLPAMARGLLAAGGAGGLVWLCLTGVQTARSTLVTGLLVGGLAAAVLVAAVEPLRLPALATPLVGLGRISYGVYLWHYPIVRTLLDKDPISHWPWVALLVAASVLAGWASYVVVERRFWRPPVRGIVVAA